MFNREDNCKTVGKFFEEFDNEKDSKENNFLYIEIANFEFMVTLECEYSPPNVNASKIPVVYDGLINDDISTYHHWSIPEGYKEEFLKYCKFEPDENPFVLLV